jgi:hypothetical protein
VQSNTSQGLNTHHLVMYVSSHIQSPLHVLVPPKAPCDNHGVLLSHMTNMHSCVLPVSNGSTIVTCYMTAVR